MHRPTRPERLGRYRILAELGRGNMGVIYKAEDPLLERTVAVKTLILSSSPEERAEYEARFYQEAKATGGFNHPNVITVYDVGREGEVAYMAMELLDGVELRDLMKRGRVPLDQTLDIVAQVADGLAFVHERGVIHRDIKPGNVMVMPNGRAKIMDFGIARVRVSEIQTQAGAILGSPKYMSPEQVTSQPVDHRSDLFSLGVVLYEAATGTAPFFAKDVTSLMHEIATAMPRPPSAIDGSLPPVLDLVIKRALAKEPDARYQNASEFARDLRACLAHLARPARDAVSPKSDGQATTTVEVDAGGIAARTEQAAASAVNATVLRAGDLTSHLSLSRRFDSAHAYRRLTEASPTESQQTPQPAGRSSAVGRWLCCPEGRLSSAALVSAIVAAVVIAVV